MANARYGWAVDILDVQPNDIILEIGCGYGHSIPLICEKLTTGHLTAIDRSAKMADAASKANAAFVDAGKVSILHQDLLERLQPSANFDKIFLFNINVFWMDPREEIAEVRRLLKPDGRFYLFHQPPPGQELQEFEEAFRVNLCSNSFEIVFADRNAADEVRSLALVAAVQRNDFRAS